MRKIRRVQHFHFMPDLGSAVFAFPSLADKLSSEFLPRCLFSTTFHDRILPSEKWKINAISRKRWTEESKIYFTQQLNMLPYSPSNFVENIEVIFNRFCARGKGHCEW